jgi:glucokinase
MTETNDTLVVGVDIGGTKVAAGLVDREGAIKSQTRTPMVANREADEGLAAVISAIDVLFAQDPKARTLIRGIGICAPGPLDPHTGVVLNPPNVPCWRNFPLAAEVAKVYDVPVKGRERCQRSGAGRGHMGRGTRLSSHFLRHHRHRNWHWPGLR